VREAAEETGAVGLALGEVIGSVLFGPSELHEGFHIHTYNWLTTTDTRDSWDHIVASHDDDHGMRFRCEFRPTATARIDWGLDCLLDRAVERFTALRLAALAG
jgi:hypothetical protein